MSPRVELVADLLTGEHRAAAGVTGAALGEVLFACLLAKGIGAAD